MNRPEQNDLPGLGGDTPRFRLYALVAIDQPVEMPYSYGVPAAMEAHIAVGSLVTVPLLRQRVRGCVVALGAKPPEGVPPGRIKAVHGILTPGFQVDPALLKLANWMTAYYLSIPGDTIACVSFIGFNDVREKQSRLIRLADVPAEEDAAPPGDAPGGAKPARARKLTAKQLAVVNHLAGHDGAMPVPQLLSATGAGFSVVQRLLDKKILEWEMVTEEREDEYSGHEEPDTPLDFNPSQRVACDRIVEAMHAGKAETFLLHGVTGSGKTEVYLQAIARALAEGGEAVVLVPEISLTPQTVSRFRRRFGGLVGVYHSRMTIGQKYDLWRRVRSGACRIMVGARSAIFTPFPNLRIVIIDEEHEQSYKQDAAPRYHARDVAIMRAHQDKSVVVLGSATPSVESYFKAKEGKFRLLVLPERIHSLPLPQVEVLDMARQAKEEHDVGLLSRQMVAAIEGALARREQVLLLLNRRGFFNFMVCVDCQTVVKCRHCDCAVTHHRPRNSLLCHYCDAEYQVPTQCSVCQGTELSLIGTGSQRLEEHVRGSFPGARVIRVDVDSMRRRTAFIEAWRRIENHEVDIILGTQMIAKGFHLENVTVVGVPLADVSLHQPDFRCAERAFALLTQVAGRTGRGGKPGRVIIQTYVPQHYAVEYARTHDYLGFYQREIQVRKVLRFPPHARLVSLLIAGEDAEKTAELAGELGRCIKEVVFRSQKPVAALGPAPAPLARLRDMYRWRLILRAGDYRLFREVIRAGMERFREIPGHSKVEVTVDVDPQDLL